MEKKEEYIGFATRLRSVRQRHKLSQDRLAELLGQTGNALVSRYELGQALPTADVLIKLSEVLEVDLHWLLTGQLSPMGQDVLVALKRYMEAHIDVITHDMGKLDQKMVSLQIDESIKRTRRDKELNQAQEEYDKMQGKRDELLKFLKML